MIELRVLNTLTVRDHTSSPGADIPLAPRQAALLVYLAIECARGRVARARLLGVFWPELPEDRARASLRQALYRLRVELKSDFIVSSRELDIELHWAEEQCDAVLFDRKLDRGDLEGALDLYRGELLAGFHLAATSEFEQWLDTERNRFRQRAVQAAATLAQRAEGTGNPAGAAAWLRNALVWSPHEEPLIRDLTRLLVAIGDRSGAIHAYESFASRLTRDLELEPSASLQAAIAALRATEPAGPVLKTPQPETKSGEEVLIAASTQVSSPPTATPTVSRRAISRPLPRSTMSRLALFVALAIVLGAFVVQRFGDSGMGAMRSTDLRPNRVLVLPLENRTDDTSMATLGRMSADWVTQSLQRSGLVEVIDPNTAFQLFADLEQATAGSLGFVQLQDVARAARARIIVWGSVAKRDENLEFQVQITDASDGTVLRTLDAVTSTIEEIPPALEVLRTRIAGALATVVDERLASIVAPSSPPPTFEAYQAFAEGMDVFLAGNMPQAAARFARAAQLDSTFITARFWQAYALGTPAPLRQIDSLMQTISPMRDRLSPAERAGLDAFLAEIRDDWEGAVRAHQKAAELAPQSNWAYMAAFSANKLGRHREALAHLAELDPRRGWLKQWMGYWQVRLNSLHQLGEYEEELAVVREGRQIMKHHEPSLWWIEIYGLHALAGLGRLHELDQTVDSLARSAVAAGRRSAPFYSWAALELRAHGFSKESQKYYDRLCALMEGRNCMYEAGRYADAYAELKPLADSLDPRRLGVERGYGWPLLWRLAAAEARLGMRDEAERTVNRITTTNWGEWRVRAERVRIAALNGDHERAVKMLREMLSQSPLRGDHWYWLHHNLNGDLASIRDALRDDPFVAPLLRTGGYAPAHARTHSR